MISSESSEKLNVELNLVPFIDLLSTLVLFLLVTAVWIQVSALPVGTESAGGKRDTSSATPAVVPSLIAIRVGGGQLSVRWTENAAAQTFESSDAESFKAKLLSLQATQKDAVVSVGGEDTVEYGGVIAAIDMAKNAGFKSVGLSLR